jgi:hypothetical protein
MLLQSHGASDRGLRSDKFDFRRLAHFGKIRIFTQETVAGMNGIDVRDFGGADHRRNIEITARTLGGPNADGFIGEPHVQAVAIGLRVNGHRLDAQILAGADDANGDFASIGDQDFLEHITWDTSMRTNGEQGLSVLHRSASLHQLGHHGSGNLALDFVHQLHRFDDAHHLPRFHCIPHLHERRIAGLR